MRTTPEFRKTGGTTICAGQGNDNPATGPIRGWGWSLLGRLVVFDVPQGSPSDSPHPGV